MTTETASTATVQGTTLADLTSIVADLQRQFPLAGQRAEKAATIVLFRAMDRSESGGWFIQSETDPEQEYIVTRAGCTCQDSQRNGHLFPCKHIQSTMIVQRLQRVETDREQAAVLPSIAGGSEDGYDALVEARLDAAAPVPFALSGAGWLAVVAQDTPFSLDGEPCEMVAQRPIGITRLPMPAELQALSDELFGVEA